jgi:hypothetical protein
MTGLSYPAGLATDGTDLYCAGHGDGTIERIPINADAGAPTLLVFSQDNLLSVATAGGSVFWGNLGPLDHDGGYSHGTIMQVPADGAVPARLASQVNDPSSITADSTNVYWTQIGAVMSVAVDGGTPTLIAPGQQFPGNVAVDGTNVYWTDPMAGVVMKRVK